MSPQSRATISQNTTFAIRDDGASRNLCPSASSVAEIARAANMEYALHKIESESSATTSANSVALQPTGDANTQSSARKRSSACISSSSKSQQPFLSSYGSAFLSGIFADIADASDDQQPQHAPADANGAVSAELADNGSSEPCRKKARSTSFGRETKSLVSLAGLAEGAVIEASSASVVSPRSNTSALKNQEFNDQVRELQDMAFPSLPHIPITVSSSSCSGSSWQAASIRPLAGGEPEQEHDSPSYGWFVSTDDDQLNAADQLETTVAPTFLPGTQPDLAFKALTPTNAPDQDLVVQQALAADTIDDVLGDLF